MERKPAILTIDDAPSPLMAERVAFLDRLGIRAVWFCRGDRILMNPEGALSALRSGHILGNHSWSHPRFSGLGLEEAAAEIDRTEEALERIHREAGVDRPRKLFRFPYEDRIGAPGHHAALQALLASRGFLPPRVEGIRDPRFLEHVAGGDASWFWTYDSEDWTLKEPGDPESPRRMEAVLARMDRDDPATGCGLPRPGTEVVILHDHGHTGAQWEAVVEALLARGLEFRRP